jgi:hypothetical protein
MYANYTQDLMLQKYRWVSTQMSGMWRGLLLTKDFIEHLINDLIKDLIIDLIND